MLSFSALSRRRYPAGTTAVAFQQNVASQSNWRLGSPVCEEGGRILDPFAGSGTTLVAADLERYSWTGIEMTGHYFKVARSRVDGG
ncbi:TPA: hypothetical protein QEM95_21455 [Stenotrophomonas maltophilia]|nr:hypothetical protein [Stenotrophomonas maltophilia]